MKKILFALVALLPLLVSCGKEDRGDNSFKDPHFLPYAGKLIMNSYVPAASSVTKATDLVGILESIEFTESGLYVVGRRMDGKLEFLTGSYKVNGDTYDLDGFGTVKLTVTRASLTGVIIRYLSGLIETLTAEFMHATGTNVAYRGWTIDRTRVTINGFHTPASADFKSTDHGNCNAEWWKDAFSNDYVLSRDDFRALKADFVGVQNIPAPARTGEASADAVYDLSGRKIAGPESSGGIRIRNGRKYYDK